MLFGYVCIFIIHTLSVCSCMHVVYLCIVYIIPFVNLYALYLIFKMAVETLQTARQEEKIECAQKVERVAEKALSTLAAANQKYVDAESRQLQSFMSQVKEDLAAHATEVRMSTLYATLTSYAT